MTESELIAGRYKLQQRHGQDAIGTDYLAFDQQLDMPVRLKHLHGHLIDNEVVRKQFFRELLILRKLSHPNVVTGYEYGEDDEHVFFSTEMPEGMSLTTLLEREKFESIRAIAIFRTILETLDYVHQQGILHRNLQPEHIFIKEDDSLKIGGFGMGKLTDLSIVTMRSQIMSSPIYSPPELLSGNDLDATSDFYNAGIIFAQLLTGKKLWPHDSLMEQIKQKKEQVLHWGEKLSFPQESKEFAIVEKIFPRLFHPDPLKRWRNGKEIIDLLEEFDHQTNKIVTRDETNKIEENTPKHFEESCLSCGEPMADDVCLACGFSTSLIKTWGSGPYTLSLSSAFRHEKKGMKAVWQRDILQDRPEQLLKAQQLLEPFLGEIPDVDKRNLQKEFIFARNVDKKTAKRIQKLFQRNGLKVSRLYTGRIGNLLLSFFSKLSRIITPLRGGIIVSFYMLVIVLEKIFGKYFMEHYFPSALMLQAGPYVFPTFMLTMLFFCMITIYGNIAFLSTKKPNVRLVAEVDEKDDVEAVYSELIDEYNKIETPAKRLHARRFFQTCNRMLKSIKNQSNARGVVKVIRDLELQVFQLLGSASRMQTADEKVVLTELRNLSNRFEADEKTTELQAIRENIEKTLEHIEKVKTFHIKVDAKVEQAIESLDSLKETVLQLKESQFNKGTAKILEEITDLVNELPEARDDYHD